MQFLDAPSNAHMNSNLIIKIHKRLIMKFETKFYTIF